MGFTVRDPLPVVAEVASGQYPVDHADSLTCREDQRLLMRVVPDRNPEEDQRPSLNFLLDVPL